MQGADLEKIGRTLNRVIKWDRDGMTIEADQRHVREILKNLELEQANSRGSKGENQCKQGLRHKTQLR